MRTLRLRGEPGFMTLKTVLCWPSLWFPVREAVVFLKAQSTEPE